MAEKAKIRVIKKNEIKKAAGHTFVEKQPKKESGRKMSAIVMNWVDDIKNRKRGEPRLAMEQFHRIFRLQKS